MYEVGSTNSASEFTLSPEWTVEEVIQRYPLSLQFFHDRGFPGETTQTQLKTKLRDFADYHNVSLRQLEVDIKSHLKRAVQPHSEECERNLCYVLLFCPHEFKKVFMKKLKRWIPFVKEEYS